MYNITHMKHVYDVNELRNWRKEFGIKKVIQVCLSGPIFVARIERKSSLGSEVENQIGRPSGHTDLAAQRHEGP